MDVYLPPREYFWNVLFTLDPVYVDAKIKFLIKWNNSTRRK